MASDTHYFTREVPMGDIGSTEERSRMPGQGNAMAQFYTMDVKDNARTEQLGRYCSRKIDMVRIIIPGDKHNIVERRIKPSDQERWPKQYEAFRKMEDYIPEGTLIDTWPMISRAQCDDLKYQNIFTVEQLAELSDEHIGKLGLGARQLCKHAKAFIEVSKTGAAPAKLVAENEMMRGQIDNLTSQLATLTSRLEILMSKAGEDVSVEDSPVLEAKLAVSQAKAVDVRVTIPKDLEKTGMPTLRELCKKVAPGVKVLTRADAVELLEEYRATQTEALK